MAGFFSVTFFVIISMSLMAQQSPQFNVHLNADTIGLEDVLRLTFTMKNGNPEQFNPPDFDGWHVIAGPNTSSEMQIINGKMTQRLSYTYYLRAPEEGLHIIGKASASVNDHFLETEPQLVYVLPGKILRDEPAQARQWPGFRAPGIQPRPPAEQPTRRRPLYRM